MKSPNVAFSRRSDLKYVKHDLKLGKNDLKYYDLKWIFPLGGLPEGYIKVLGREGGGFASLDIL